MYVNLCDKRTIATMFSCHKNLHTIEYVISYASESFQLVPIGQLRVRGLASCPNGLPFFESPGCSFVPIHRVFSLHNGGIIFMSRNIPLLYLSVSPSSGSSIFRILRPSHQLAWYGRCNFSCCFRVVGRSTKQHLKTQPRSLSFSSVCSAQ
jgi:hypothetical protein